MREGKRVRSIRQGRCRIVMSLEENSIYSGSYTCAGKRLDKFRLAAAGVALSTGKLHGMAHVKNDGITGFLHHGE